MKEKKFYRVRLADMCPVKSKIVNGLTLTKQWQIKVGEAGEFAKFPDVEAQAVVKKGNGFAPEEEAGAGASKEVSGPPPGPSAPAQKAEETQAAAGIDSEKISDFNSMTVEQLKNYLIAKGVAQNELRNAAKPDLIERAEFIWSQNKS